MATTTVEKRFCDATGGMKDVRAVRIVVNVQCADGRDDVEVVFNESRDLCAKARQHLIGAIERALAPNARARSLATQVAQQTAAEPEPQAEGVTA